MGAHALELYYFDGHYLGFVVVLVATIDDTAETAADNIIQFV